jgi:hypothetical protein
MFLIFVKILRISLFLVYPLRILCGITWRLQKEPSIKNSKVQRVAPMDAYERTINLRFVEMQ